VRSFVNIFVWEESPSPCISWERKKTRREQYLESYFQSRKIPQIMQAFDTARMPMLEAVML
jgi:hypothetical protein